LFPSWRTEVSPRRLTRAHLLTWAFAVWLGLVTASGPEPIQRPTSQAASFPRTAAPTCISGRTSYLLVRLAFHPYPQVIPQFCNTGGFGPRRGLTRASPCPWVAHPVSGLLPATLNALFRLAFAPAPRLFPPLNLTALQEHAADTNSPDHSSKGTPSPGLTGPKTRRALQASTACGCGGSGSLSSPSRGAFHPSLTVLVHYRWPGVLQPWRVVPPASHRIPRVPWYSGSLSRMPSVRSAYGTLTLCGAAFQRLRPPNGPHPLN